MTGAPVMSTLSTAPSETAVLAVAAPSALACSMRSSPVSIAVTPP
jgi:hypothetical protein